MSSADVASRVGHNVTVDPSSPATPVHDPEIAEILDLVTGEIMDVATFIGSHRYDDVVAQRTHVRACLKKDDPAYACALCWTPVYLVSSTCKRFFFRHLHEDGSCRAQTRSALTEAQIRARKYHGLRESQAHKRIKSLIERSLRADPAFDPESILTETRWKASDDSGLWRQPDVQARSATGRFAFEAQLSTTFLDVVVERSLFYQAEGATLVWVLGSFLPEYRRMTTDDLLFTNNANVFVVDDDTVAASEERKRFHLRCHYRRPLKDGDRINEVWDEALVCFHDLTVDAERRRIFYFDFAGEMARITSELDQGLREEFTAFWLETVNGHFDGLPESKARWSTLKDRFAARNVALPDHPTADSSFRNLIQGVLSAKYGRPTGWQFTRLIEVAHHLAEGHPEHLLAFGYALKLSSHDDLLRSQDTSGKWKRRRDKILSRVKARDPKYMPSTEWLPVLSFLFPEVGAAVKSFIETRR